MGECPPGTPAVDSDGDGWFDGCDVCPFIVDPLQEDTDGDGVGDQCDNCVFNKNPGQEDHNLLAEIDAFGLPPCGAANPRPSISPEIVDACNHIEPPSSARLTAQYPGDVCDPHPIAAVLESAETYHDDTGRSLACKILPGKYCSPGPGKDGVCPVERGNVFHATEFVGDSVSHRLGLTRALVCACPIGVDLVTCQRAVGLYGCDRSDVVGGGTAKWIPMSLAPLTPTSTTSTLNLASGIVASNHPNLKFELPHEEDWGWRYWRDVLLPPPTPGTSTAFEGLLWTWVRSTNPVASGTPSLSAPVTGSGVNVTTRQFVRRIDVTEEGDTASLHDCTESTYTGFNPFPGLVGDPLVVIEAQNPIGPPGPGDPPPDVFATAPSFGSVNISDRLPTDVLAAIRGTSGMKIVPAYDAPQNWKGIRSGVIYDPATGRLVSVLGVAGGAAFSEPLLQDPAPPFVVAVSGHRQEAAVFGLRDTTGKSLDVIEIFDFDLRAGRSQAIISARKLVSPVAATYRAEDDSYYLLDRATDEDGHATLRLVAATKGGTIEQLREWRTTDVFQHFDITTAYDGSLLISAWSDRHHMVVRVRFAADLLPRFSVIAIGDGPLALPALGRFEGVYLVRMHKGKQVLERVADYVDDEDDGDDFESMSKHIR